MNGSSSGDPSSSSGGSQSRRQSGGSGGANMANTTSGQTCDAEGKGDGEVQLGGESLHDAFKVVRKLGEGAFGKVDMVDMIEGKASNIIVNLCMALRYTKKPRLTWVDINCINQSDSSQVFARKNIQLCIKCSPEQLPEVEILRRLDHAHIIKLAGFYTFSDRAWFLMSPVASSDLGALLHHQLDRVLLRSVKLWFSCLASALEYVHGQDIIHGDIKPRNILVYSSNQTSRAFLSDFGSARRINATNHICRHSGLTPKYGAPELHHETSTGQSWSPTLGRAADIFSLGCVFLEMATVISGHSVKSFENFRSEGVRSTSFYETLPNAMRWIDVIRNSIHWECQHFNNCLNTIKEMLDPDPWRRPTAKDVARSFPRCICKPLDQHSRISLPPTGVVKLRALEAIKDSEKHAPPPDAQEDKLSGICRITSLPKSPSKVDDLALPPDALGKQLAVWMLANEFLNFHDRREKRMSHLQDEVVEVHVKTFEWVPNHLRMSSLYGFFDWLKNEGGSYWVGAKHVLGKSTLSLLYDGSLEPPSSLDNLSIMAKVIAGRPISQYPESDRCFRVAITWLKHCLGQSGNSLSGCRAPSSIDKIIALLMVSSKYYLESEWHLRSFSGDYLFALVVLVLEGISADPVDSLRCRLFPNTLLILQAPLAMRPWAFKQQLLAVCTLNSRHEGMTAYSSSREIPYPANASYVGQFEPLSSGRVMIWTSSLQPRDTWSVSQKTDGTTERARTRFVPNSPAMPAPNSSLSSCSEDLVRLIQSFEKAHGQEILEGLQRIRTSSDLDHDVSTEDVVLKFVKIHRELTVQALRFERAGKFAEAELLCREAVTSGERMLGPNSSRTIDSIVCFARVLDHNVGQEQEVHTLLRCASERFKGQMEIERGRGAIGVSGCNPSSALSNEEEKVGPISGEQSLPPNNVLWPT
ncbi:kinase-like protein [Acephala macrosclerotiorum]|nr:kinase-like protein [Acephala macrosclerotiorum]